jgi:hypothetical protein
MTDRSAHSRPPINARHAAALRTWRAISQPSVDRWPCLSLRQRETAARGAASVPVGLPAAGLTERRAVAAPASRLIALGSLTRPERAEQSRAPRWQHPIFDGLGNCISLTHRARPAQATQAIGGEICRCKRTHSGGLSAATTVSNLAARSLGAADPRPAGTIGGATTPSEFVPSDCGS